MAMGTSDFFFISTYTIGKDRGYKLKEIQLVGDF